jgi:hypothetical protein
MPVRPLRISPALAAERLDRFLVDPSSRGAIAPGAWTTTEHVEGAVRAHFGSLNRQHLLGHLIFVARTLSAAWLPGAPVDRLLDALASGKDGFARLIAGPIDGAPAVRFGVFSTEEVLARHTRAPARGSFLRSALTCEAAPPPPSPLSPPERLTNETYRQSMERVVFS